MATKRAAETSHMTLSVEHATALLNTVLIPNTRFALFYEHFRKQGMRFFPDRVSAVMYLPPAPTAKFFAVSPVIMAVVPGFVPMSRKEPHHDAASISVVSQGERLGVLATSVRVGHAPFELQSFTLGELNEEDAIVWKTLERKELERKSAASLAKSLGAPYFDSKAQVAVPGMADVDMVKLASSIYGVLLEDKRVNPSYRPLELQRLVRDGALVEKWALLQSLRYGTLRMPGARMVAQAKAGTSSSTSCQGCTSTSTSVWPD